MESKKIISLNPSKNYEIIGEVDISTHAQIDKKISKARSSQAMWASLDIKDRVVFLEKLYLEFKKRKDEIRALSCKEMGMPISVADKIDFESGLNYMRGYLDNAKDWLSPEVVFKNQNEIHYLSFEPKGVAGISIPWNYPFQNFIWGVVQNLVVGNTVVFKHSEECPLTGKLLEDITNSVNLPDGVFNEVYGDGADVGDYLMNGDIDLIYFTGSTNVGRHLYQTAAKKLIPIMLELGGSAPGIVFKDADIDRAVELIYMFRYANSGQACDALKRLIVHQSMFDEVVHGLKKMLKKTKVGDAQDPLTDLGPLVAERQVIALQAQVADAVAKGAQIIAGGKRPAGLLGAYYEPTILTNITTDMRVWKEEVFGPVLPIISFDSHEQAVGLANDTPYGLGGYVFTQDSALALHASKLIKAGNISINGANYGIAQDPFGGYKNSGFAREHGKQGLRELCSSKTIALKK